MRTRDRNAVRPARSLEPAFVYRIVPPLRTQALPDPRQRHSTVVLRAPGSFINETLWPEFLQIKAALDAYLNEATERIIREEVFGNSQEPEERVESAVH